MCPRFVLVQFLFQSLHAQANRIAVCRKTFDICKVHRRLCQIQASLLVDKLMERRLDERADPHAVGIARGSHRRQGVVRAGHKVTECDRRIMSNKQRAVMAHLLRNFALVVGLNL